MFLKNDILSMEILSRSLSELQRGNSCRFCGRAEKFDNLSREFLWVSNELLISAFRSEQREWKCPIIEKCDQEMALVGIEMFLKDLGTKITLFLKWLQENFWKI